MGKFLTLYATPAQASLGVIPLLMIAAFVLIITCRIVFYLRWYTLRVFLFHFERFARRGAMRATPELESTLAGELKRLFEDSFHDCFHTRNKKVRPRVPRFLVNALRLADPVVPFVKEILGEASKWTTIPELAGLADFSKNRVYANRGMNGLLGIRVQMWVGLCDLMPAGFILMGVVATLLSAVAVVGTLSHVPVENPEAVRALADTVLSQLVWCLAFSGGGLLLALVTLLLNVFLSVTENMVASAGLLHSGLEIVCGHCMKHGLAVGKTDLGLAFQPPETPAEPPSQSASAAKPTPKSEQTPSFPLEGNQETPPLFFSALPDHWARIATPPEKGNLSSNLTNVPSPRDLSRADAPIWDSRGEARSEEILPEPEPVFPGGTTPVSEWVPVVEVPAVSAHPLPTPWQASDEDAQPEPAESALAARRRRLALLEEYLVRAEQDWRTGTLNESQWKAETQRWGSEKQTLENEIHALMIKAGTQAA